MIGAARRFTIYVAVVSQIGFAFCGCRQETGVGTSRGGAAGNAATAQQNVSVGEIAFRVVRAQLEKSPDHPSEKVAALDGRRGDFIQAVDAVIPPSVASQTSVLLDDVLKLVDDDTLPSLTRNIAGILDLAANDPQDPQQLTLNALASLANAKAALDTTTALKLASRLLAYRDIEDLLHAVAQVVSDNDGKNGSRDLLTELLGVLSRRLAGLSRPQSGAASGSADGLIQALLESIELRGNQQVGAPAWAVRADANGNPRVATDPRTGRIYAPFVDANRDGVADVNAAGDPIDAQGNPIAIPAFGTGGSRDADQRALASDGRPLYVYFDAKRTALGQLMTIAGEVLARDVLVDLLKAIDSFAGRVSRVDASGAYIGYADDNPMIDLAWGGLEVFRYKDAPKLLEGASALIQRDRAKAEQLLVHLAQLVDILRTATFQAPTSGHDLVNDLVPLLDEAFRSNGQSQSSATARALLNAFETQQARLRNLPAGLAKMMKYSDVAARRPVGPGEISMMERLLNMMEEANHCDYTIPFFGHINMADVYLDAMAGNFKIFGITVSVYTLNSLSFLFPYLCTPIQQQNVTALHDFAVSGALDAMIPIAKVFSDANQTPVLRKIMLALQAGYAQDMRPNEPVVVEVLESGAVEELFDALHTMTTVSIPSTGERMSDVVADFLAAMVDRSRGVHDRFGRSVPTLLHLVLNPLKAMSDRMALRGVKAQFDAAANALLDVVLQTVPNDNGTPQNLADDFRQLQFQGLIPVTAQALKWAAGQMSMFPNVRNADITRYQQSTVELLTGRDMPVLVDVVLAAERSGAKPAIHAALVHMLTPDLSARQDVYGSLLEVLAALLQAKSDPVAMTDLLRFAGKALEPQRGFSKPVVEALVKLLSGSRGNATLLEIIRNAVDKGPNGTAQAPIETLLAILDEVQRAAGPAPVAGAATAQSVKDAIQKIVDFLRDPQDGLEHFWAELKARRR